MSELFSFAMLSLVSLFTIIDPIGAAPAFLAMTPKNDLPSRLRMAKTASVFTFGILVLFFFFGQWIFLFFSVTLPAFQIAGGIILMVIALNMLEAKRPGIKESSEEMDAGAAKNDVAITPMAVPMLAGPGAITTIMVLGHKAPTLAGKAVLLADLSIVCIVTYFVFRYAFINAQRLNVIAISIMSRILGLILSAIAIQFILNGIREATHLW